MLYYCKTQRIKGQKEKKKREKNEKKKLNRKKDGLKPSKAAAKNKAPMAPPGWCSQPRPPWTALSYKKLILKREDTRCSSSVFPPRPFLLSVWHQPAQLSAERGQQNRDSTRWQAEHHRGSQERARGRTAWSSTGWRLYHCSHASDSSMSSV